MFISTFNRLSSIRMASGDRAQPVTTPDADKAAQAHVRDVTRAAGSSFYWAMRVLPATRRDAMFAIYAFCREVDDIADGDAPTDEKRRMLDEWRAAVDRVYDAAPTTPTARALQVAVRRFDLRRRDFMAIIDGMAMDVGEPIVAPSLDELESYCRRVAGAVGLLSIRAFGATQHRAEEFALALGSALQLTNILRDLKADAAVGRLYLPDELLRASGIETRDPAQVLDHPALPDVCGKVAAMAAERYDQAVDALADCPGKALRPAVVMMRMYRRILDRLNERGWRDLDSPVSVSKPAKIWIAIRYGIL